MPSCPGPGRWPALRMAAPASPLYVRQFRPPYSSVGPTCDSLSSRGIHVSLLHLLTFWWDKGRKYLLLERTFTPPGPTLRRSTLGAMLRTVTYGPHPTHLLIPPSDPHGTTGAHGGRYRDGAVLSPLFGRHRARPPRRR